MRLLDLWKTVLDEEGLRALPMPGIDGLGLGLLFEGENGRWRCFTTADDARSMVAFYSMAPVTGGVVRRGELALFITRVNFGLPLGCFELDLDDGEVRFRTSLVLRSTSPDKELLRSLIWANVAAMDRYLPGLVAVCEQSLDARRALQLCVEREAAARARSGAATEPGREETLDAR